MAIAEAHVPLQNLEAEESVLGVLMVSEGAMNPVILDVRLAEEGFYRERLFDRPLVNVNLVKDSLGVAYVTANNLVAQFEPAGILTEITGGRRRRGSLRRLPGAAARRAARPHRGRIAMNELAERLETERRPCDRDLGFTQSDRRPGPDGGV